MKTCNSEVPHVFVPSLFAFPCRIKTSRTSCSSRQSNCDSTSQDQFISWLHGVCACLCWPGTSRGDQEAGARGTGKGHGDKVSVSMPQGGEELEYLGIPDLARPAQPQNIILWHTAYMCILITTFLLFCCFCCEVQELPEEEALARCGSHLDASMHAALW